ncbi:MAG: hypothetical protein ACRER8_12110 [Pseudomonas sp.]|uniref:hypothetical protein n=1 Tax=Pseudomonas sp. TaxID=306 RepID=UPI003D6F8160
MTGKEAFDNQVKLIFAKACADSLVGSIGHFLSSTPECRAEEIEAVAELHAVACVKMMKAFNPSTVPELIFPIDMTPDEKSAWVSAQADSWSAIAKTSRGWKEHFQAVEEGRPSPLVEAHRRSLAKQHQSPPAQASDGEVPGEENPEALLLPVPSDERR